MCILDSNGSKQTVRGENDPLSEGLAIGGSVGYNKRSKRAPRKAERRNDMAQQYTRNMIRNVFIEMLDEKPFDEITVTDLVTRCEINRKTFYYYYQDLYAVLTEIFQSELESVIGGIKGHVTWEEGIAGAMGIAIQHKRAVYHVYHSMQRETLEKYLYNVAGEVMIRYVERESEGIHASQEDKNIIAQFYQSALTEMVLNWIGQGMKEDGLEMINRIGQLFDGNIRASLKRSENLPIRPWKGGREA